MLITNAVAEEIQLEQPVTQPTAPNTRSCKDCQKPVVYTRSEKVKHGKTTKYLYRDHKGSRWNGAQCPSCKIAEVSDSSFVVKKRKCLSCGACTANYYRCKDCTPYRAASDMMDLYGVAL